LKFNGHKINRKRVQRLMRLGGTHALYPGPKASQRNKLHAVHPYLLRNVTIERLNQAWMIDITHLRMRGGFMYLVVLVDVHRRYIVSWSLPDTMETGFCMDALKKA